MTAGTLREIRDETPDVKTFVIEVSDVSFVPGQYCLVSLPGSSDDSRPFTFANSPTLKGVVELTVKKMGRFTSALFGLRAGDIIEVGPAMGSALNYDESADAVFLAGGSGITPFMSALRYAKAKKIKRSLILIYSNRTEKDIIYRTELEGLSRIGNLTVVNTLSDGGWAGETGRISRALVEKYVKDPCDRLWYICGPPPMTAAMKAMLEDLGIPKEKWRYEDWEIPGKNDG
ncbi:MAG: FAD-binding oxidoreductase [archaeon]